MSLRESTPEVDPKRSVSDAVSLLDTLETQENAGEYFESLQDMLAFWNAEKPNDVILGLLRAVKHFSAEVNRAKEDIDLQEVGEMLIYEYWSSSPHCRELFGLLEEANKNYSLLWQLTSVFNLMLEFAWVLSNNAELKQTPMILSLAQFSKNITKSFVSSNTFFRAIYHLLVASDDRMKTSALRVLNIMSKFDPNRIVLKLNFSFKALLQAPYRVAQLTKTTNSSVRIARAKETRESYIELVCSLLNSNPDTILRSGMVDAIFKSLSNSECDKLFLETFKKVICNKAVNPWARAEVFSTSVVSCLLSLEARDFLLILFTNITMVSYWTTHTAHLLRLLNSFKNDTIWQMDLIVDILNFYPVAFEEFVVNLSFSLEPRVSIRWRNTIYLLEKLFQKCVTKSIYPSSLSKILLNRGISHSHLGVQYGTLFLLEQVIKLHVNCKGDYESLRNVLPDFQNLFAVRTKLGICSVTGEDNLSDWCEVSSSLVLNKLYEVFMLYQMHFSEIILESRIDIWKLCDPDISLDPSCELTYFRLLQCCWNKNTLSSMRAFHLSNKIESKTTTIFGHLLNIFTRVSNKVVCGELLVNMCSSAFPMFELTHYTELNENITLNSFKNHNCVAALLCHCYSLEHVILVERGFCSAAAVPHDETFLVILKNFLNSDSSWSRDVLVQQLLFVPLADRSKLIEKISPFSSTKLLHWIKKLIEFNSCNNDCLSLTEKNIVSFFFFSETNIGDVSWNLTNSIMNVLLENCTSIQLETLSSSLFSFIGICFFQLPIFRLHISRDGSSDLLTWVSSWPNEFLLHQLLQINDPIFFASKFVKHVFEHKVLSEQIFSYESILKILNQIILHLRNIENSVEAVVFYLDIIMKLIFKVISLDQLLNSPSILNFSNYDNVADSPINIFSKLISIFLSNFKDHFLGADLFSQILSRYAAVAIFIEGKMITNGFSDEIVEYYISNFEKICHDDILYPSKRTCYNVAKMPQLIFPDDVSIFSCCSLAILPFLFPKLSNNSRLHIVARFLCPDLFNTKENLYRNNSEFDIIISDNEFIVCKYLLKNSTLSDFPHSSPLVARFNELIIKMRSTKASEMLEGCYAEICNDPFVLTNSSNDFFHSSILYMLHRDSGMNNILFGNIGRAVYSMLQKPQFVVAFVKSFDKTVVNEKSLKRKNNEVQIARLLDVAILVEACLEYFELNGLSILSMSSPVTESVTTTLSFLPAAPTTYFQSWVDRVILLYSDLFQQLIDNYFNSSKNVLLSDKSSNFDILILKSHLNLIRIIASKRDSVDISSIVGNTSALLNEVLSFHSLQLLSVLTENTFKISALQFFLLLLKTLKTFVIVTKRAFKLSSDENIIHRNILCTFLVRLLIRSPYSVDELFASVPKDKSDISQEVVVTTFSSFFSTLLKYSYSSLVNLKLFHMMLFLISSSEIDCFRQIYDSRKIYSMLTSHSLFSTILCSGESSITQPVSVCSQLMDYKGLKIARSLSVDDRAIPVNGKFSCCMKSQKIQILSIITLLCETNRDLLESGLFDIIRSIYTCTGSTEDILNLKLLKLFDSIGFPSFSCHYPVKFGAISYSLGYNLSEWLDNDFAKENKVSSSTWLDEIFEEKFLLNGPPNTSLFSFMNDEYCYDPDYLLPLLGSYLSDCNSTKLAADAASFTASAMHRFAEKGYLSYVIVALANSNLNIRQKSYYLLGLYFEMLEKVETANFRESIPLKTVLKSLRDSIVEPFQQLPTSLVSFLSLAVPILMQPYNNMYLMVNKFILRSPTLDLNGLPLFYDMFQSSSPKEFRQNRSWILKLSSKALKLMPNDILALQRFYVFSLSTALFDSNIASLSDRTAILDFLRAASKVPEAISYLVETRGYLGWINSQIINQTLLFSGVSKDIFPSSTLNRTDLPSLGSLRWLFELISSTVRGVTSITWKSSSTIYEEVWIVWLSFFPEKCICHEENVSNLALSHVLRIMQYFVVCLKSLRYSESHVMFSMISVNFFALLGKYCLQNLMVSDISLAFHFVKLLTTSSVRPSVFGLLNRGAPSVVGVLSGDNFCTELLQLSKKVVSFFTFCISYDANFPHFVDMFSLESALDALTDNSYINKITSQVAFCSSCRAMLLQSSGKDYKLMALISDSSASSNEDLFKHVSSDVPCHENSDSDSESDSEESVSSNESTQDRESLKKESSKMKSFTTVKIGSSKTPHSLFRQWLDWMFCSLISNQSLLETNESLCKELANLLLKLGPLISKTCCHESSFNKYLLCSSLVILNKRNTTFCSVRRALVESTILLLPDPTVLRTECTFKDLLICEFLIMLLDESIGDSVITNFFTQLSELGYVSP